jgi:2',3'-cyclic-nucleotide 2'-phosphodiesterase (5'-nucleotidase family)
VIDLHAIKELKNPIVSKHLNQLMKDSVMILNEPVTYLQHPIEVNWYQPSPLPQLLTAALRKWTNSEVGFLNAGLLLEGLPSGVITKGHIHKICPHPINPCVVYLTGAELLTVINRADEKEMIHMQVKGFGFRGKVMGMMIYDGLSYTKPNNQSPVLQENVWINGYPLELDRRYRIGTIDMFTFGHLYPTIHQVKEKEFYLPKFLRDLLQWALSTGK